VGTVVFRVAPEITGQEPRFSFVPFGPEEIIHLVCVVIPGPSLGVGYQEKAHGR
jgi:hypothetical protein